MTEMVMPTDVWSIDKWKPCTAEQFVAQLATITSAFWENEEELRSTTHADTANMKIVYWANVMDRTSDALAARLSTRLEPYLMIFLPDHEARQRTFVRSDVDLLEE